MITVAKLYKKPRRTKVVRDCLAQDLADFTLRYSAENDWPVVHRSKIEVFVEEFDPESGSVAVRPKYWTDK